MILNYTTEVPAFKTVGEIQSKLAKAGAHQILHEYNSLGAMIALSFRIHTRFGEMSFRLPANIEAVEKILLGKYKRFDHRRTITIREQSERTGWRILKDWVEAQLALLQTGQVTMEQVFLAYAQNATGQTIYEALVEKRFTGLALPAPKKVVQMEEAR